MVDLMPLSSATAQRDTVGGKGANLAKLARAGMPVPDGFLVPVDAYRTFVVANALDQVIAAALAGLDVASPAALEAASSQHPCRICGRQDGAGTA